MQRSLNHCIDVQSDRALGALWDRNFCRLAASYGKMFTAHQIGRKTSATAYYKSNGEWRRTILPDITLWSAPGEHHEIKHKSPTDSGYYGLEEYRLESLVHFAKETKQRVFYTIHDWSVPGRDCTENCVTDWMTCEIGALINSGQRAYFDSWVNGEKKRVPGRFWARHFWQPLVFLWWSQ